MRPEKAKMVLTPEQETLLIPLYARRLLRAYRLIHLSARIFIRMQHQKDWLQNLSISRFLMIFQDMIYSLHLRNGAMNLFSLITHILPTR